MLLEHDLVVHLVDVIAGQDHDELEPVALDDVDVLVDRIGRALVPHGLGDALARRQDVEALVALGTEKFQPRCRWRMRLCALYWVATAMWRMPELRALESAKSMMRDLRRSTGGLDALVGQLQETAAAPSGQNEGQVRRASGAAGTGMGTDSRWSRLLPSLNTTDRAEVPRSRRRIYRRTSNTITGGSGPGTGRKLASLKGNDRIPCGMDPRMRNCESFRRRPPRSAPSIQPAGSWPG